MADQERELDRIDRRLGSIEYRLTQLEKALNTETGAGSALRTEVARMTDQNTINEAAENEEKGLESQIGRFGLAWLGNIVLLLGIAFLEQYLITLGQRVVSVSMGYGTAAAIYYLAFHLNKSNVHLALIFKMNARILLFYVTLSLHFFTGDPLIRDTTFAVILLLGLVGIQTYVTIRDKSQVQAGLSVVFAFVIAVICDTTNVTFPIVVCTAAGVIWYYKRYRWEPLLIITIVLSYIIYFLWLFSNPLMGHKMELISEAHSGIIYLFLIGSCFSLLALLRREDNRSDDFLISAIVVNGFMFTLLLMLVTLRFYHADYVPLYIVITVCCLIYSTILKTLSTWNFASAFFALYGFMAMTISLYGIFGLPRVYLLLSVQSLMVVSLALWFRNRLIVIMNSLLFLAILIVYILSSDSVNGPNFSFALVSLISARIINWKRERLQIETDLIRNLYLTEGFFMVLYALYHAVPGHFITLSWTLAALLYFLLSFLLNNVKYRYLALGTMICAAFYLFLVDLARIEIVYRVLAFLVLAAISIGISMYYSGRIKKPEN